MTNPLVATPTDAPVNPWAGVWIAEDIQLIGEGVTNGSWIDGSLGVVGAALDGLALVSDPVGSLLQYGVAWIIEHVRPLTEALDWLAGDPAQIAAHAQTWRNVAGSLRDEAESLARAVRLDVTEWGGSAGPAYRNWAAEQQQAVVGLSHAADTMALVTEGAGMLIAAVRLMVRDAIATCVSRLIVYAAEEAATLGFATPLVVEQVTTTVAAWAAKIAQWLRGLLASLRRLIPEMHRLGELIEKLKQILSRLRGHGGSSDDLNRVRRRGSGPRMPMNLGSVQAIAAKYGIDISDIRITINNRISGVCGITKADESVLLCRDAFRSEEDLARTLEHERFHVAELRDGRPYPAPEDLDAFEDRAYAHEDHWWETQSVRPEGAG
ncbi:WXG100 family type VII secretion target [Micromonospora globispora]|uniref:WXG100 family type VII secretion target n=1 Tax=Micromonospora globispora TaxID=1450148 RepID=UPI001FAF9694|nr:WXG100 family type VII secretion target [Micromonospora globispora]